jgi:hypothetical protein
MTDTNNENDELWPDDLEMGDTMDLAGHEYKVVGTAPGKATIERVDDDSIIGEVFRWALTDQVGIEIERQFSQSEFEERVEK